MRKGCDTGRLECPHKPKCMWGCDFTVATINTGETTIRKIAPYPAIPADIDPVPDTWHRIGAFMLWSIFTVLAVICLGLFFTGVWICSLLI